MIHFRHIVRAATSVFLLGVLLMSGTAANARRVAPPSGGGDPEPGVQQAVLDQGTPFWVFLVVGAGCVVLTILAYQIVLHLRGASRQGTSPA